MHSLPHARPSITTTCVNPTLRRLFYHPMRAWVPVHLDIPISASSPTISTSVTGFERRVSPLLPRPPHCHAPLYFLLVSMSAFNTYGCLWFLVLLHLVSTLIIVAMVSFPGIAYLRYLPVDVGCVPSTIWLLEWLSGVVCHSSLDPCAGFVPVRSACVGGLFHHVCMTMLCVL